MKKLVLLIASTAMMAAVPAWADKPSHPVHPAHPAHPSKGAKSHSDNGKHKGKDKGKGHGKACVARNRGYNARGTLVSGTLTPGTSRHHYDGTLTVDVTRANHKAPTGTQTFTLTDARVHFGKGVDSSSLGAGDGVKLHGKITALPHRCDSTGFTPTITIRHVRIRAPKSH